MTNYLVHGGKPYTLCVFAASTSTYLTIVDAKACGYTIKPQAEETLAGYLSPGLPAERFECGWYYR